MHHRHLFANHLPGATHDHTVLEDGHHRHIHRVDHVLPDGKFVKLFADVTHSPHWVFVPLDNVLAYPGGIVECGTSGDNLLVLHKTPPKMRSILMNARRNNNLASLIVHANPRFHCNGTIIFRRVNAIETQTPHGDDDTTDPVIALSTYHASYWDVFQHAHVEFHTDFTDSQSHEVPRPSSFQRRQHRMHPQVSFGDITKFVSKSYDTGKKIVDETIAQVKAASLATTTLSTGDLSISNTSTIFDDKFTNNTDVTKKIDKWDIQGEGDFKVAASVVLSAKLSFILKVSDYKLQQLRVVLNGSVDTAVRTEGNVGAQYSFSKKVSAALNQLPPIMFVIVVIPVVIRPSVPVTVGIDLYADVQTRVNLTAQGTGSITIGYEYGNDGTFIPIKTFVMNFPKPKLSHNVSGTLTLAPFVEPTFIANIDIIGSIYTTLQVIARGILSFDPDDRTCILYGSMNIQCSLTLGASIGITAGPISIVPVKVFGPWTLYTAKTPVYAKCLLLPAQQKGSRHFHVLQATDSSLMMGFTAHRYLGRVYTGVLVPADPRCGFLKRTFSLQVLNVLSSNVTFVGTISTDGFTSFQVQQVTYIMQAVQHAHSVTFTQLQNDSLAWKSSTSDNNSTFILTYFTAIVSNDLTEIIFSSSDNCSSFMLSTLQDESAPMSPTSSPTVSEGALVLGVFPPGTSLIIVIGIGIAVMILFVFLAGVAYTVYRRRHAASQKMQEHDNIEQWFQMDDLEDSKVPMGHREVMETSI